MSFLRRDASEKLTKKKRAGKPDLSVWILLALGLTAALAGGLFRPEFWQDLQRRFYLDFIVDARYMWLVTGLRNTIIMTIIASVLGALLGLVLSLIRVAYKAGAPIKALDTLSSLYITVMRGTPVMIQLMIIYFGIFVAAPATMKLPIAGLAFGLNSAAYVAENFRAGIESIDIGQMEAGRSLGMTYGQSMRKIVLPQATRNVLPTLFNELITLLKETSVAGYIGLNDLTRSGQAIKDMTGDPMLPFLVVALVYLVIVMGLTRVLRAIERRLSRSDRG